MKNNKYRIKLVLAMIGIILTIIGFIFIEANQFKVFFAVLAAAGFNLFCHYLGKLGMLYTMRKNPEEAKRAKIAENDERNMSISNQAKSKAFDAMGFIFGTLIVVYALLRIDIIPLILLVVAYLAVYGLMIYYIYILRKKM